jgi:hypothetical protein
MKKKQGRGGLMALKLDMERAFDRMEWSFLFKVLSSLGFSSKWIHMIDQCISTVSFSILVEGSPFGKFAPSRGLRQWDPLSPFLFILGSEALSRLLIKEELAGNLHGIKISRNSPPVSHLLFADDLMVFSKGTANEASCIMRCISKFSSWSGQQVNLDKSSLFLSKNISSTISSSIQDILNLRLIPSSAKHLGLPLFFHRNKSLAFEDLKNKFLNRILGWKAKILSQAAHTTLIRTVANSLASYSMSLFLLLRSFCQEIDSCLRKFWWGAPLDKKHSLCLLGWKKICSPKSVGGLGLRTMEVQNSSLLAKLGWQILSSRDSLWVKALTSKYLHASTFLSAQASPSSSWLWKGILKCSHIVRKGVC